MKKKIKLTTMIFMATLVLFSNLLTVEAVTVPDTLVVNTTEVGNGNNPLKLNRSFAIKKTSDGKYMYCMDYHMLSPKNTTYKNKGLTDDNGVNYIVSQGATVSNDNDYFIVQTALWIYLLDYNLMQDSSYGSIKAYKESVYSSQNDNNKAALAIRDMIAKAKSATKIDNDTSLTVDKNISFTKQDDYYKTSVIKVSTTADDYEVKLENSPSGAKVEKVESGFVIKVPATSLKTGDNNFKAVVTANQNITNVYVYKDPNGTYQPVSAPYTDIQNMKDEVSLSVDVPKTSQKVVSIIKRDKDTNKILEGASLSLLNEKGEVIEEWTSTKEAHLIYDLANGKYSIIENSAPNGYEKSDEKLTFEVNDQNELQTIIFYNQKSEIVEEEVINVPVESTGMNKSLVNTVAGMSLIGLGIAIVYKKSKKRINN